MLECAWATGEKKRGGFYSMGVIRFLCPKRGMRFGRLRGKTDPSLALNSLVGCGMDKLASYTEKIFWNSLWLGRFGEKCIGELKIGNGMENRDTFPFSSSSILNSYVWL